MSSSLSSQVTSTQTLFSLCNQRQDQRYYNSQGSPVELLTDIEEITKSLKGMIVDDSFSGCGLIVIGEEKLLSGQLCSLKIKNVEPILCQIVWSKKIERNILRLGIKYLIKSK